MASVFMAQELFTARGLKTDQSFRCFLSDGSFVAIFGALFLNDLLTLSIPRTPSWFTGVWAAVVFTAMAFCTDQASMVDAAVIAIVLGGSQALSRSLFSRMIPAGREASFLVL